MTEHAHDHSPVNDAQTPPSFFDILETSVQELLIEQKLFSPGEIRRQIEVIDSRTPALGATIIARALLDSAFRARLPADGRKTCEELGITIQECVRCLLPLQSLA